MTGLFFTGNVVFGGIAFFMDDKSPEGSTPFSVSDFYIGNKTLERVLIAVTTFAQLLPMVPLYSLKAAAFVVLLHSDS